MQHIALLGLGIMGSGMATNWLNKGFELTIYNRTRSKAEPLAALGAHIADSPRDAAQQADIVVAMVTDDAASRAIWLGDNGALSGARPGTLMIECSTVTPDWERELAQHVKARGCDFLECPVAGSKGPAAAGQLVLFVGGDAATLDKARPALEAISREINHLGEVGMGATWKLINNMLLGVHIAAVSEALVLAEQAGLDRQQVATLIATGPTASGIVKAKLPRLMEQRFVDTEFSLNNLLKDARYALALAERYGVPVAVVEAAADLYRRAQDAGLGDQDMAAVIESIHPSA